MKLEDVFTLTQTWDLTQDLGERDGKHFRRNEWKFLPKPLDGVFIFFHSFLPSPSRFDFWRSIIIS